MIEKILVSIITPVYNSEKYIGSTIISVLNQSYTNWELLLIDDCSIDRSKQIIDVFSTRDSRIKYLWNKENSGVAAARNTGIKHAKGVYIAFLDSDDLWDEDKLKCQLAFMMINGYLVSHTAYRKINYKSEIITKKVPVTNTGISYKQLLKHNEIGCLTAMYNVEVLGKHFFIKIGHEDYVYWLSLLKSGTKCFGLNTVLASYRVHSNTISSNKIKAASFTWKIYRNIERFSVIKSLYYFSFYAVKSLIKYYKR